MREIRLAINGDVLIPNNTLAGFAGEHLNTQITIPLPESWRGNYLYQIAFHRQTDSPDMGQYSRNIEPVNNTIMFNLPQAVMVEGTLIVQFGAMDAETDRIVKSATASLTIKESVPSAKKLDESHKNLIDGTIVDANRAILGADAAAELAMDAAGSASTAANRVDESIDNAVAATKATNIAIQGANEAAQRAEAQANFAQTQGAAAQTAALAASTAAGEAELVLDQMITPSEKGAPNGVASLDDNGLVYTAQLPLATQAEAEAGESAGSLMTPLRAFERDVALSAAVAPTISGDTGMRMLSLPAGTNPNRFTLLLTASTAASEIVLNSGTGTYRTLVMPTGNNADKITSLAAYVPYDFILADIGGVMRYVCISSAMNVQTYTTTINGTGGTPYTLFFRKVGRVVSVSGGWASLGAVVNSATVGQITDAAFRPTQANRVITYIMGSAAAEAGRECAISFFSDGHISAEPRYPSSVTGYFIATSYIV